ncbi:efflux RND transporter periplasmic adaptor subunit [Allokutzneria sp. A3M-2-11 16]|uniref:efflux RND transporter periplasmic adaptor subunit n=1 Tax=Allokutzneria sp. A3M-2-11 16 TaxID=2962043 RepID=UPI0020B82B4A|nr:efflux RND transporter periplasmic adaptor subunit [Allokutzneria sp. A3M-2-11 16]MCP3800590.1 efflux RND transporter periplasmic adaptor subunit [Allokutzneria sp. A3M-2-11 16]
MGGLAVVAAMATACGGSETPESNPELAPRGTTVTTAKVSRQSLTNKVSLTGKVTMNPVFGLTTPVNGEIRYLEFEPPKGTPTKATKVAEIYSGKRVASTISVPAKATFAGRLVEDRASVTGGMPVVSARYAGYGIVAEIDGDQAYKMSGSLSSVEAQITNGPGPFPCSVLGTIAAMPAGSIPAPEPDPSEQDKNKPQPTGSKPVPGQNGKPGGGATPSEPTGLRLVCTAPTDVKMINGSAATVEVVTDRSTNALVLPVEAVAGTSGRGKVDVLGAGGARKTVDVELGLTDGKVVEIKSGLSGDETVAVPGPNLPAGPGGKAGGGGSLPGSR